MILYNSVLVCVTQQRSCERLIHAAAQLKSENGMLYVLHVTKEDWNFVDNARDGEALEYLFSLSKSYGADLTLLHSNRITETIAQFAQHYGVDVILVGEGPDKSRDNTFIHKLDTLLSDSDIRIRVVPCEAQRMSKAQT